MRKSIVVSSLVLLASTAPAPAQNDKGIVRETTGATVIEVPVNVLGKDGLPLPGLTAADFELTDNGKKQTISGFEVVDLRRPAAATRRPPVPRTPSPSCPPRQPAGTGCSSSTSPIRRPPA